MRGYSHPRAPGGGAGAVTAGVSVLPDHVRVDFDSNAAEAWRDCADVLFGRGEPALAAQLLDTHPGCLLVSVRNPADGRCTAAARGGLRIEAGRVRDARDHALVASALYGLLLALNRRPGLLIVLAAAGRPTD